MALESATIKLVTGDASPDLIVTLTDRRTGLPVDLTGVVSAEGHFRAIASEVVLIVPPLYPLTPLQAGKLRLVWPLGSLNIDPGRYEMEVQLTGSGGRTQTPYDTLQFRLRKEFA